MVEGRTKEEIDYLFAIGAVSLFYGVMCLFGAIGNLISIRTFLKMGVRDGITVSFLLLSTFDLVYLLCVASATVAYILYLVEEISNFRIYFPIDPYGLDSYFANAGSMMYCITLMTVTYMAVVRCLCVANPLYFRNTFTRETTKITVSVIVLFAVVAYVPVFVILDMVEMFDDRINATRLTLCFASYTTQVTTVIHPFVGSFIPLFTQVAMIISACIMAHHLRNSLVFRNKHALGSKSMTSSDFHNDDQNLEKNKQTSKELHAIQQTFLITTVFIVCNLPKVVFNISKFILPNYSLDRTGSLLIALFECFRDTFQILNSSTSIFIYYKYNTKFQRFCLK